MSQSELDKPIFIIGAARSGTTVLGQVLSSHPDVAYWLEPKYVWRYRNAKARHDIRTSGEASEKVKAYIRKSFESFIKKEGKSRFVEKTPSNVFRIPFIYTVFPEARFIHIVRDGRDVCLSAEKKWTSPPDGTAIIRRLRSFEIPLVDLCYYIFDAIRDVPGRMFLPKKGFIWGPRFEGIQSYRKTHTVLETSAMQWVKSMEAVDRAFKEIPTDRVYTIKYEDLTVEPERHLEELCKFMGLSFERYEVPAAILKNDKTKKIKKEDVDRIESILPIIKKTLSRWAYLK